MVVGVGGWRLVVGGDWPLAVGGVWWLAIGGWWGLAVGGGWGGWRSLRAILNKKKFRLLKDPLDPAGVGPLPHCSLGAFRIQVFGPRLHGPTCPSPISMAAGSGSSSTHSSAPPPVHAPVGVCPFATGIRLKRFCALFSFRFFFAPTYVCLASVAGKVQDILSRVEDPQAVRDVGRLFGP